MCVEQGVDSDVIFTGPVSHNERSNSFHCDRYRAEARRKIQCERTMTFYKFTGINFKSQFGAYVTGIDLNDISGKMRYFDR